MKKNILFIATFFALSAQLVEAAEAPKQDPNSAIAFNEKLKATSRFVDQATQMNPTDIFSERFMTKYIIASQQEETVLHPQCSVIKLVATYSKIVSDKCDRKPSRNPKKISLDESRKDAENKLETQIDSIATEEEKRKSARTCPCIGVEKSKHDTILLLVQAYDERLFAIEQELDAIKDEQDELES